jgi:5-methylthioribose kinase
LAKLYAEAYVELKDYNAAKSFIQKAESLADGTIHTQSLIIKGKKEFLIQAYGIYVMYYEAVGKLKETIHVKP